MEQQAVEVQIRPSNVDEMRNVAGELAVEHWEEIALNKAVMKLSINWVRYYELEERGALVMIGAWLAGDLVGYSVNFVYQHMHYSELTVLHNDVFFVGKAHRNAGLGLRLLEETEEAGRKEHCDIALFHSKPGSELQKALEDIDQGWIRKLFTAFGRFLGLRGYGVQDILHSKVL